MLYWCFVCRQVATAGGARAAVSEHRNPVLAVTIPLDNLRGQFLTLFQDGSHVEQVLNDVPLQPGSLVIDCTSGDPVHTQALAARLLSERGIRFTDAPVSGGPTGAAAGTVTSMVGGAPEDVAEAMPLIKAWSKKVVHCGPVGAGDATKSVNNVLNSAHLLLATEGMVS